MPPDKNGSFQLPWASRALKFGILVQSYCWSIEETQNFWFCEHYFYPVKSKIQMKPRGSSSIPEWSSDFPWLGGLPWRGSDAPIGAFTVYTLRNKLMINCTHISGTVHTCQKNVCRSPLGKHPYWEKLRTLRSSEQLSYRTYMLKCVSVLRARWVNPLPELDSVRL